MIVESLKVLHFAAFSVGIGGGLAGLMAGLRARAADPGARPALGALQRFLGRASAVSVLILWASGIALVYQLPGGWSALPPLFWAKFAAVVALTGVAASTQWLVYRGMRGGRAPGPATMLRLGVAANVLAPAALVLAVLAFTP